MRKLFVLMIELSFFTALWIMAFDSLTEKAKAIEKKNQQIERKVSELKMKVQHFESNQKAFESHVENIINENY